MGARPLTTDGTPTSVVLAGDSVGGGLALALLHRLRGDGADLPVCAVRISPFLACTASGASLRDRADQDPIFTPGFIRGIGPVYLGNADHTNRRPHPYSPSRPARRHC